MTDALHAIEKIPTELKPHEGYLRGGPLTFRFNSMAWWPYAGCEVHALRYPTNAASFSIAAFTRERCARRRSSRPTCYIGRRDGGPVRNSPQRNIKEMIQRKL
jgi:hypothetical protein